MFQVVRVVHKFDFSIVVNLRPNKERPVERRSCSNRDSCFGRNCMFPLSLFRIFKGLYPRCAGKLHSVHPTISYMRIMSNTIMY